MARQVRWIVCAESSTPEPKSGAQCVSSARWDLRGGPPARAVPTAIPVQPGSEGGPAASFAAIEPPVGSALGQGAVEPLDLAVSLGTIGSGPLVDDGQLLAGRGPELAAVAAAVVG